MSYPPGGFPPPQYPPQGGFPAVGFPAGGFGGGYPPPKPPKKSKAGLIVGLVVGVVALLAICGGAGALWYFSQSGGDDSTAAGGSHSSSSSAKGGASSGGATTAKPPAFKVGDCFQVDEDGHQPGTCGDGSSPYKIYRIADSESGCNGAPWIVDSGHYFCLKFDLQVNYCYTNPGGREWVKPATTCKAPGTAVVFDVLENTQDHSPCDSASHGTQYWTTKVKEPQQVICYWLY